MKKIILGLAVAAAASVASAQYTLPGNPVGATYLIAGFDFSQFPHEGDAYIDDNFDVTFGSLPGYYSDTTVNGDRSNNIPGFVPAGIVYFDGTNGSDLWDGEGNLGNPNTVGGSANIGAGTNATIATSRRDVSAPVNLVRLKNFNSEGGFGRGIGFEAPGASSVNDIAFVFNTTGYGIDFDINFAAWVDGAASSIEWLVQTTSGLVSAGNTGLSSSTPSVNSIDFGAFASSLENRTDATIIARLSGPDTAVVNFDNLQFIGQALPSVVIPEPSTYAMIMGLVTVGIAVARRRRSLLLA